MSLIDQALKKTQSALNQKKVLPTQTPSHTNNDRPQTRPISARPQIPLFARQSLGIPAIMKYGMIGALSIVAIIVIGFEIHSHYTTLTQRYNGFYGKMFSRFSQPKKIIPVAVAEPPLVLNGTLETGIERIALINQQLYHVNEIVDGYLIKQIHYNRVVLQNITTHKTRVLTPKLS